MASMNAVLGSNKKNPYSGGAWQAVKCAYCKAPAGKSCVVKDTRSGRLAQTTHDVRYEQRYAAYDAWEEGHKQGVTDAVAAIQEKFEERKVELEEAG